MAEIARQLAGNGHKPYVLETSRHGLSVVAYVNAVVELTKQTDAFAENPTRVYVTSSGAALGGILLGSRVLGIPWEVVGIDHRSTALAGMRSRVSTIMGDAAARLGLLNPVGTDDISILSSDPTTALCRPPEPWSTLSWVARNEGVLLDPVHTGWGMSIALQDLRSRPVGKDGRVIFVHTGGTATLFAHDAEVTSHLRLDRDWNAAVPGLP
jgi:1-aminocyclopropane-1-carboxylate deaminase/D-cysteine desulfhydrase-like pyridoxal-dependent ACC family enzyme